MLGIVVADDLITLFTAWELTSITSYLLIGVQHTRPAARAAALQALLITSAGGLVLLAGIVLIAEAAGTFSMSEILADPPAGSRGHRRAGLRSDRGVHQVGAIPVPLVAPGGDGCADTGQRLPALGDDGQGWRVPPRALRPRVRLDVAVEAPRAHRRPRHDGRRRAACPPSVRPQAAPRLRHGEPARLPRRPVRSRDHCGHAGRRRPAHRPCPVQGDGLHGRRDRRSPDGHAGPAPATPAARRVDIDTSRRHGERGVDGRRAVAPRLRRQGIGVCRVHRRPVQRQRARPRRTRHRVDAHGRLQPAVPPGIPSRPNRRRGAVPAAASGGVRRPGRSSRRCLDRHRDRSGDTRSTGRGGDDSPRSGQLSQNTWRSGTG